MILCRTNNTLELSRRNVSKGHNSLELKYNNFKYIFFNNMFKVIT